VATGLALGMWAISINGLAIINPTSRSTGFTTYRIAGRAEGFTPQTPTPLLIRPRKPHQNFNDFSKSLGKSKNFIYYEEYSNYHDHRVIIF
jgi:hypothetical protein